MKIILTFINFLSKLFRSKNKPIKEIPMTDSIQPPQQNTVHPEFITLCAPLTKISENCVLHAYPDPGPTGLPWTIGWGCTGKDQEGNPITQNTVWSQDKADYELNIRLLHLGTEIDKIVHVPITPAQKAALTDFAFNCGINALATSTLLKLLNAGDYQEAANQFQLWVHSHGVVLNGMVILS